MPHVLIAGIVASKPKSDPFPTTGRPHAEVSILVDGADGTVYRIIATAAKLSRRSKCWNPVMLFRSKAIFSSKWAPPQWPPRADRSVRRCSCSYGTATAIAEQRADRYGALIILY